MRWNEGGEGGGGEGEMGMRNEECENSAFGMQWAARK